MIEIVKRVIVSVGLALMMSGIANAEVSITQGKLSFLMARQITLRTLQ